MAGAANRSGPRRGSLVILCSSLALAGTARAEPLVVAVKATFLYKFAPFVDWPPAALGPPGGPFAICVVGHDPFGDMLDRAITGQRLGDHPIVVRRMATVSADTPCQILFVGGSPAQPVKDVLKLEQSAPVLTVTDESTTPGVIDFVPDPNRVRFRINDEAAAEHGLTIRAQLLNLATSVTPRKAAR